MLDILSRSHWPVTDQLRQAAPFFALACCAAALTLVEPPDAFGAFATVFLGILFEALPFLLAGVLLSAAVQTWAPATWVRRLTPRGPLRGALAGAAVGALLPVCECGVVPVVRRLLAKGAGLPAGLGFLLAGPVVNPVVFVATWTALGWEMAVLRTVVALGMAIGVAGLLSMHPEPAILLRASPPLPEGADTAHPSGGPASHVADVHRMLLSAGAEFLDMGRYLVLGAAAAALLRTLVPTPALLSAASLPALSVGLLMLLAAVLSICSVVDAFVALSLSAVVPGGALLAFLVFGPVVDVKSVLLYGAILRWRTVAVLVALLAQSAFLVGVVVALNVG